MPEMTRGREIVVGARGSMLSVRQTETVIAALSRLAPSVKIGFRKIVTLGDRKQEWLRSDTGIFVKELEDALLRGEIDIAVHSVKDMPSRLPQSLMLGAVPAREDPRDLLISQAAADVHALPPSAHLGTSSLRRKAQLLHLRPDLRIEDLRGNLDSRIRTLREGRYDAIVVAAAGVRRLAIGAIPAQLVSVQEMLPSPGQGALGLEIRSDDAFVRELVAGVDDRVTHACIACERAFLRRTQAGCRMPVAALAGICGDEMKLDAMIIALDGKHSARVQGQRTITDGLSLALSETLGETVADEVLARGGQAILEEIRHAQE